MSQVSPSRPTRRAAQRRKIVDSDDEDNAVDEQVNGQTSDVDADFALPSSPSKSRRPARRNTQANTTPGAIITSPRRRNTKSIIETPSQNDILPTSSEDLTTSVQSVTRPKRRNVRASRRSQLPILQDPPEIPEQSEPTSVALTSAAAVTITQELQTTPDSTSSTQDPETIEEKMESQEPPELLAEQQTPQDPVLVDQNPPLADITATVINEQPAVATVDKPEDAVSIKQEEKQVDTPAFEKPMDIVIRTRTKPISEIHEPSEPKPRLVITHLVLNNFKSYAGRQEVGPFHASFSSVVGPNGSGKSNVIDSLLFVFGFRASKMRQGKISALIHNSAAHPDLPYCEVQVHFQEVIDQPGCQAEVIPDSQLVISRRAFKNNSSKYYLNGTESNFTVVTTLLRDRGIDLDHKRFLILQGEVESIAQMKPKAPTEHDDGLLEYLEDIIGTSKYKTPIEESAAEVEKLNEICVEKNNRVSHVEKEKKSLETKKDAALTFIKNENDLNIKQSALYQMYVTECQDNIQIASDAVNQMQSQLGEESEKYRDSEKDIRAMQKQYEAETKEFSRMEESTQAILKQVAKADKDAVKFEEKKKHLQAKVNKAEKNLSAGKFGVSEALASVERCDDDLSRSRASAEETEARLQTEEQNLTEIRDSLKTKTQGLSDQVVEKQKLLEPWTQQIDEKRSAIAVAQSELNILKERDQAGATALSEAQAKLDHFKEEKSNKQSELQQHKEQLSSNEKQSKKLQASLDSLAKAEPSKKAALSAARQKTDEARSSLAKSQTQGNVLAGLKRLKDSGRIQGFHGRLGDLGAIDSKYDVAISTACPALDNLVVDSVEVGQQCIEYLRKNNLGRANFILLNRLSDRNLSAIDTPENVPRLFDLVKSKDDIFRAAFYSVLQNTLVADDLTQANRIAYGAKRWRVVTLDGQLIDKSGTMSGGGNRTAKGAMSSKLVAETSTEQVAALEAEQEKAEQDFSDMQAERQRLETELKQSRDSVPALNTKIQKCTMEIESIDRNIADAQKRCSELQEQDGSLVSDTSQQEQLAAVMKAAEKEIEKLEKDASGIQEEIQSLQDKIMEVGGVKLRGQKAKVDGLRDQIAALSEEMANSEGLRSKAEKQRSKHEKAIRDAEKELKSLSEDMEKIEEETQRQHKDVSGAKRQAEEAQEALDAKKEALEALKAAVDEKTAEINEARGVELEMRNQLEEHQKTLSENQKRLKYWEEKLSKLQLQQVSDLGDDVEEQSLATYTRDELADFDKDVLKADIAVLEEKTSNANVELGVVSEYRRRVEEHAARSSDLNEAVTSRDAVRKKCEELRRLRLEGFMEGFSTISLRLKEMYRMITMGGNAELELVDSLDPFSEGILFSVMPPKKSWKNISNLSGGEKTLSSLALVFALHHYKPTPLYVMDEIDAALDFRNVSIVASYIKERTKNAQFIVISLRNNMFELASRLVGVYKVNHMTKSVTVENRDYIFRAQENR